MPLRSPLLLFLAAAIALSLAGCGGTDTGTDTASTSADAGTPAIEANAEDVDVFELAVGDCLTDDTEGQVSENTKVDCATPHASEVYHLFNLPDGDMPQADVMENAGQQGCLAAFEAYVGLDFDSSEYTISTLQPTEGSWSQGDREVVCLLTTQDGSTITGSLRNAKR